MAEFKATHRYLGGDTETDVAAGTEWAVMHPYTDPRHPEQDGTVAWFVNAEGLEQNILLNKMEVI